MAKDKDCRAEWQEARRLILDKVDVTEEYRTLGAKFTSDRPTSKGWLPVIALFRPSNRTGDAEESTASAAVCVNDSAIRGRYNDKGDGTGKTISLFDAAVKAGKFLDFASAVAYYANKTGVSLPNGADELPADRLDFFDPTPGMLMLYASGKPGVTVDAMRACGVVGARWPRGLSAEFANHLLCWPMYGPLLLNGDPSGYHCVAANPRLQVRKFQGKDKQPELVKSISIGPTGLIGLEGLRRLPTCETVVWNEGISDLLTCWGAILEHKDEPEKYAALSLGGASCHLGAEYVQHFAGKRHWIVYDVGDKDGAGQTGAAVLATTLVDVAIEVRNGELPAGKQGGKNDFRSWRMES